MVQIAEEDGLMVKAETPSGAKFETSGQYIRVERVERKIIVTDDRGKYDKIITTLPPGSKVTFELFC